MKDHTVDCNILSGPQGRCTCQKHVTITPLQGEFRRLMHEHEQLQKDYKKALGDGSELHKENVRLRDALKSEVAWRWYKIPLWFSSGFFAHAIIDWTGWLW